jgi:hypothetical protein
MNNNLSKYWEIKDNFILSKVNLKKCLDAPTNIFQNITKICVWDLHNGKNQQWSFLNYQNNKY